MDAIKAGLEFLQQPQYAMPICAIVIALIAGAQRKVWTAGYAVIGLAIFLIDWHLLGGASRDGGNPVPMYAYAALVIGFFGVATWEAAWVALYVALMPIINWSFAAVPTAEIPAAFGGGQFQPLAIVTGLVLVVRDLAQRQVKNWVLAFMVVGLVLSTLTSWIVVVVASGVAFLISETVDWAVYTFSDRPLSQRIMISSTFSAPLDQVVFIYLASFVVPGIFAWGTVLTGIASKLIGAFVVSRIVAAQERRAVAEVKPA